MEARDLLNQRSRSHALSALRIAAITPVIVALPAADVAARGLAPQPDAVVVAALSIWIAATWRIIRTSLYITPERLVARNLFRTRVWQWHEIDTVTWESEAILGVPRLLLAAYVVTLRGRHARRYAIEATALIPPSKKAALGEALQAYCGRVAEEGCSDAELPLHPLFVADAEGVDLAVFRSVADAEGFIEPADIPDAIVFDGLGRRLTATLEGRRTRIALPKQAEPHDPELVQRIMSLSRAANLGIEDETEASDWTVFVDSAATVIEAWMAR